jgi:hypothetical protein
MSYRTLRVIDLYCAIWNWNNSIAADEAHRDAPGYDQFPWRDENEQEIVRWTAMRDRKLAALHKTLGELTADEKDFIRRRCGPEKLAKDLRQIGVKLNWLPAAVAPSGNVWD